MFNESIDQYIYDEHYDSETDDVQADWQNLSRYDEVCKILNELNEESK